MILSFNENTPISDLHTCIQGEGKYAGIPHILIRLSGCNLRCQFKDNICDTPYSSWFPEKGKFNFDDVKRFFEQNKQINHTFITGGEPFLFPDIAEKLIELAKKKGHFVAAETNGSLFAELPFDFITISPKLKNSIPVVGSIIHDVSGKDSVVAKNDKIKHERQRFRPEIFEKLISNYEYILKFVVEDNNDLIEISDLVKTFHIPNSKIYLMPEGIRNDQIQKKRKWIIEKCIDLGYNYSDRLHIIAYGEKREA